MLAKLRSGLKAFFISLKRNKRVLWSFAGLALIVIVGVYFWFVPKWTTPEFMLNAQGSVIPLDDVTRSQLENDLRKTWAQIAVGIVLMLGVIATFRRTSATERSVHLLQEGQITERFTRAIEQLGSDKTAICLGGIYALERIAKDSPENDHRQVMEVLTAYVRENTRWVEPAERSEVGHNLPGPPSTVIQAILTVLGRRNARAENPGDYLDLSSTKLRKAKFSKQSFGPVNFTRAYLEDALLDYANLEGSNFYHAHLEDVFLNGSNLDNASFYGAHLNRAELLGASLQDSDFAGADLQGSNFQRANLERANLTEANLQNTDFLYAHLEGANLYWATGLTPNQLTLSYWDEHTVFPKGFEPPPMRQD